MVFPGPDSGIQQNKGGSRKVKRWLCPPLSYVPGKFFNQRNTKKDHFFRVSVLQHLVSFAYRKDFRMPIA